MHPAFRAAELRLLALGLLPRRRGGVIMDVLRSIAVELTCLSCGRKYRVPLDLIAASQRAMHEGCPVAKEAVRECPQESYSALVDEAALQELERAWARVEQQLLIAGGRPVVVSPSVAAECEAATSAGEGHAAARA